jgi:hypothetical protein
VNAEREAQWPAARLRRALIGLFAIGLIFSTWMMTRAQFDGDALALVARGWLWIARDTFIPYGNSMSSGGKAPGALTTILVGLPLRVWFDARAPIVLIIVFDVIAYLLLVGALRDVLTEAEQLLFCVFYWLSPWRLYHSGFLWNPNYLFLFGALHLWSARRLQRRRDGWGSFVHGLTPVLAFQLHASAVLLAIASTVLILRRCIRVAWPALIAGVLVAALPLIPWALELRNHSSIASVQHGFPGRGALLIYPLLRGLIYIVRFPSLHVIVDMSTIDFVGALGPLSDILVRWTLVFIIAVIGPFTVLLAIAAQWWFWRTEWRRPWRCREPIADAREWLRAYLASCLIAAVVTFGIAPTTPMHWQVLVIFHVAVLVPVLWLAALSRAGFAGPVRRAVAAFAILGGATTLGILFGSNHFRCGGAIPLNIPIRADHPMLHELHVVDRCQYPIDPRGYWPDVF